MASLSGVTAVTAIAAAVLIGCGGDDASESEPTGPTAAEYREQVNAICLETANATRDQFNDAFRHIPPRPSDIRTLFTQLSPPLHAAINKIAAIEPPSELEAQVDAMIEAGTAEADRLDAAVGDPAVMREVIGDGIFPELNQAVSGLGLEDCASVTSPVGNAGA